MPAQTIPLPISTTVLATQQPQRPLYLKRIPEPLWNQVHALARMNKMRLQDYVVAILQAYHDQTIAADNAQVSASTSNGPKQDQLLRNIRVGLHECGCYKTQQLFPQTPRRFYQLVISPARGQLLVQEYRQRASLEDRLGESRRIPTLPTEPFIGELDYRDMTQILTRNISYMQRAEQLIAAELVEYLDFKRRQVKEIRQERQLSLAGG